MKYISRIHLKPVLLFLVLTGLFVFSFWLMNHTFSYSAASKELRIASKVYSDFGSNIPLIRSFSYGSNWPIHHPLYPGEPIRYHYLFYLFVGGLEKIGVRLDYALNSTSALGFFFLLYAVFYYGRQIFRSTAVGLLSLLFFLLNGSLSFLDFFKDHPLGLGTFTDITTNSVFASFGPWDGSLISAFWNLNIYTNQRHLGLSFAICLLIVILLHKKRSYKSSLIGFLTGSLLLINQAGFIIACVFVLTQLPFQRPFKKFLVHFTIGTIPWIIVYLFTINSAPALSLHPGYLLPEGSNIISFIRYWFMNIGLHLFLIPIGILIAPKKAKLLFIPLLLLFIIPNVFQLSADMINNHKLFNFFLIMGLPFSAYTIFRLWKVNFLGKITTFIIVPFLIFGGVVDFFPVKNDFFLNIQDIEADPAVSFFFERTPPTSIILNDTWFYNPASIGGRSIFNGYPYFTWSYGYDQISRERITADIYSSPDKQTACTLLIKNNINYVELTPHSEGFLNPNYALWQNDFNIEYLNKKSGLTVYSVKTNCSIL